MQQYLDLVNYVLENGVLTHNRTGIDTISCSGYMFQHDMSLGFPLLTTKKMSMKNIASELEMFLYGITSKKFLQDRNNHIWDDWCNPQLVPYSNDEATKLKMKLEDDLGPIYGKQWRCFNGDSVNGDQLKNVINTLKSDPNSRRLIVSAWNPLQLNQMALPPCHLGFELICYPELNTLDIIWVQRSVDVGLGLPYNIASYALLLLLICNETNYRPGKVIGMLGNCHIYTNQLDMLHQQLLRNPLTLPSLSITNWTSIWNWHCSDISLSNYSHYPKLSADIAV